MKKLLLTLCVMLCFAQHDAIAQKWRTTSGSRDGGVSSFLMPSASVKASSVRPGFLTGIFYRFNKGSLLVQPEVYYCVRAIKLSLNTPEESLSDVTYIRQSFDANCMVGYLSPSPSKGRLRFVWGPAVSVKFAEDDAPNLIKRGGFAHMGWQTGFGFDVGKIPIDIRYEEMYDTAHINSTDHDIMSLQLSFGFYLKN